jgi:hypothetical protein
MNKKNILFFIAILFYFTANAQRPEEVLNCIFKITSLQEFDSSFYIYYVDRKFLFIRNNNIIENKIQWKNIHISKFLLDEIDRRNLFFTSMTNIMATRINVYITFDEIIFKKKKLIFKFHTEFFAKDLDKNQYLRGLVEFRLKKGIWKLYEKKIIFPYKK